MERLCEKKNGGWGSRRSFFLPTTALFPAYGLTLALALTARPWTLAAALTVAPPGWVWASALIFAPWVLATALTAAPWAPCVPFAAAAEMMPVPKINVAATPSMIDFVTRITIASPRKDSPRDIKRPGLIQECSDVERLREKEERRLG